MEQSPSEVNSRSANQEILLLLLKPKVHKIPPLINPYPEPDASVHIFPPYFCKLRFNIIFPSTPMSSVWYLPFRRKIYRKRKLAGSRMFFCMFLYISLRSAQNFWRLSLRPTVFLPWELVCF